MTETQDSAYLYNRLSKLASGGGHYFDIKSDFAFKQ